MPWIENVSVSDIAQGNHHYDFGFDQVLIQIMDPPGDFPTPKHKFKEIHRFQFLDIDDNDEADDPEMFVSEEQAREIVKILRDCLNNNRSVIVHCFAGVARSGAVAQVGEYMGFMLVEGFRSPNTRVMRLMMNELGLSYDVPEEHNWAREYREYVRNKQKSSTQ